MNELIKLFSLSGDILQKTEAISGSGSNRKYYRLYGLSKTYIGVYGKDVQENKAFIELSAHFRKHNINVPQVLFVSEDSHYYITTDLGNADLFSMITEQGSGVKELLVKSVEALPKIQFEAGADMNYNICYPQKEFDFHTVFWDLNYFKYEFLKPSGLEFDELRLESDFEKLASKLLSVRTNTFMYRDFQSRNIMIKDGEPWFIDYQGGRKGPFYYDLASFVYQAKAKYSNDIRETLIQTYIDSASKYITIDKAEFHKTFGYFVLFRALQTLGAYGFRGIVEHKAHFIQSIPFAIENLKGILKEYDYSELPYLTSIISQLTAEYKKPFVNTSGELIVKVFSFSYKKGIPMDYSGNGGGYVFDCRAVHNPGKYPEYKDKTGLDKEVIEFIENNGEMAVFLDSVFKLADASVKRYLKRGFTDLMFSFGCTGGQHRSVYGAQHLAEHINKTFGVKVIVEHIEQGKTQTLEKKSV